MTACYDPLMWLSPFNPGGGWHATPQLPGVSHARQPLQACHKSGKDDLSRVRNTPAVPALFIYLLRTRLMLADFPPLPCGLFRACTPNATSTVGGRRKTDRDPCYFLRHKQRDLAILESGPTASTTQDASLGRKVACPGSIGVSISRACPSAMKRRRLFCAAMTKRL